jgi:hypothetical protein
MNDNARIRRRAVDSHPYNYKHQKGDFKYIFFDFIKTLPFAILFMFIMFKLITSLV